jgi:arsenite methyltransferase
MTVLVNTEELEAKVKDMYRHVAQQPQDRFHFELGAPVALRAGYEADRLAVVPPGAVEGTNGFCRGCLAGSVLVAAGGSALVGTDR